MSIINNNNSKNIRTNEAIKHENPLNPLNHPQSSQFLQIQHSNNFNLGNESNILNSNRNLYHDEESIFKSIGFFGVGNGYNSIGFTKKNEYNLISINSNSYLDIDNES